MGAYDLNHRNQPRRNPSANPSPKPATQHRKRFPEKKRMNDSNTATNKSRPTAVDSIPAKKLVLGEVKILKRGEDLNLFKKVEKKANDLPNFSVVEKKVDDLPNFAVVERKVDDLPNLALVSPMVVPSTPEPVKVPRQAWIEDSYAGSAIYSSPSPRSLPLPSFFMKKTQTLFDASNDLQRLLRLEL